MPCRLSATVLAVGGDGGDDGFDALGVGGCGRGLHGGVGGVGLGLRMAVGDWARGLGLGPVGPDSASDSASVGRCRTHKAAGRPGFAAAPRARGDLRAELVMLARYLLEKGECKNAEGGDRSFWRQNLASGRESSSWFGGDPVEKIPKVPKGSEVQSFQSSVHSGTCRHLAGDRRVEAAAGVGRCWHRRAEGRCCPTSAGVRRRPEPSLRHGCAIRNRSGPGRTPALSPPAGQLAPRAGGQERTARRDRAARHVSYIGLEPLPRGTTTCPGGWRRKLAKACTARGGAAGAVLGRHGGG